jgi:hypothetical protein
MLMLVALGIMSATWMSVIAVTDRAGPIKLTQPAGCYTVATVRLLLMVETEIAIMVRVAERRFW